MVAEQAPNPYDRQSTGRQVSVSPITWCPNCREDVRMILAEKAATVCQCSRRRIYRWIEDGDLHYVELPNGDLMVCGRSLSRKMDELDSATDELSVQDVSNTR
jgi:hypothetical protein